MEKIKDLFSKLKSFVLNNKVAVISVFVIIIAVIAIVLALCLKKDAGDGEDGKNGENGEGQTSLADSEEAAVTVRSRGGMAFEDITVYIYEDESLSEIVDVQHTDAEGRIVFRTEGQSSYVAVLEGVPDGYAVSETYEITGVDTVILLDTVLVESEDLSKESFAAGDIMKDFSVVAPDGTEYTLSELLKDKDAVVLNFWYLTCIPCKEEFPLLQEAYEKYADRVAVLAMNPVNDDDDAIAQYAETLGLTFPVVRCDEAFAAAFGLASYPTTVVIDRYGMVSLIKDGSIAEKETFEAIFEYYTDDGYVQQIVSNIGDIAKGPDSEDGTTKEDETETEDGETETEDTSDGKTEYTVTVTNADGAGVAGVGIKIGETRISTDENGLVSVRLEPGTYEVTVTVPEGYNPVTETYQLTETDKNLEIQIAPIGKTIYTIVVADSSGKAVSGVEVYAGGEKGVTGSDGKASFSLEEGDYKATIIVPDGYSADSLSKSFDTSNKAKFTLTKNSGGSTPVTSGGVTYTVHVTDYSGSALSGVGVSFVKSGSVVKVAKTDSKGKASAVLEKGSYTVELSVEGKYDTSTATLSASKTSVDILVAPIAKKTQEIWSLPRYEVYEGGTYVPIEILSGEEYCFVVFSPVRSGTYKIEVSGSKAKLTQHSPTVLSLITENTSGNVITLNIKDSNLSGNTQYVFGLKGADDCILKITRTGDAVLDESDYPYTVYSGTHTPKKFTYSGTGSLTYFDVSAASGLKLDDIVLGSDGYYHYGSASGPVIYLDFDNAALSLYEMVIGRNNTGGTGFKAYIYDDNGKFVKKEDYTSCLTSYIKCMDSSTNLYPLTEDLRYILETGGKANGWYDGASKEIIFGSKIINVKTAWLFLCCYEK